MISKIVFFGRIAPNKKQDDIIRIFDHYHRKFNPSSALYLIGQKQIKPYVQELEELVQTLGLSDNVVFTGKITDKELNTYYRNADVFVCMSEHEGFCVPLVESMFFNIPIIAYDSSAIRDTLGDASILLQNKEAEPVSRLIDKVTKDRSFRQEIIEKQKKPLPVFQSDTLKRKLMKVIREIQDSIYNTQ
jgi:glycosyltransferase involved in cell wall biosynthesis